MNEDNFVKECHLLAEDAKLVSKDKNGNVMLPASFFGELDGVLHELGIQTRCPYYIDEKQFDKGEECEEVPIIFPEPRHIRRG